MGRIINITGLIVCLNILLLPWFISCKKELSCDNCIAGNMIPTANAGPDQQILIPRDSAWLDGSASGDPDGKITEWKWSKISGPFSYNLVDNMDSMTLVRDLIAGNYEFELVVKDNKGLIARDTLSLFVIDPGQPNRPPVAVAGNDTTYTLPATIFLDGRGSHDPDSNILGFQWTLISGSLRLTIADINAVRTEIRNLESGVHRFELKVTDAFGLFARDTIDITIATEEQQTPLCNNLDRTLVPAYLREVGQLSKSKYGAAVAAAGNKIVIAGGQTFPSFHENGWSDDWGSSRVDIYDIPSNSWTTAELSKARFGIAAISAGNKIFFAGGESGDGAFNAVYASVDIYDVSTNTWTLASLSVARSYIAAAVVDQKVIFAGGEINDHQATDQVDIYDLNTNSWSTSRLSQARGGMNAVTVESKIYFAGGWITRYWDYIPSKTIDIYDNISNTWTSSSLKELSGSLAGLKISNNILWANGCKIEIWDAGSGFVKSDSLHKEDFWETDDGSNALMVKNKAVFFGYSSSNLYKDFDIYDVSTSKWSIGVLEKLPAVGSSVIAVNGEIYVIGGLRSMNEIKSMSQIWKLVF